MQVRRIADPYALRRSPSRDLDTLRLNGLSDRDLLDAVEVISYFNYINRVADALGIDPEPEMQQAFETWKRDSYQKWKRDSYQK